MILSFFNEMIFPENKPDEILLLRINLRYVHLTYTMRRDLPEKSTSEETFIQEPVCNWAWQMQGLYLVIDLPTRQHSTKHVYMISRNQSEILMSTALESVLMKALPYWHGKRIMGIYEVSHWLYPFKVCLLLNNRENAASESHLVPFRL